MKAYDSDSHYRSTRNSAWAYLVAYRERDGFLLSTLWGIKIAPFLVLTGTITLQNYAILWWFLAYRCTREYLIACLFDSRCKIENWEPAYQIYYCLLSSRQQRKTWNSCCNTRPQTSLLQTYGLLTVLTLILLITGHVEYCSEVFIGNMLKTERWWTEATSDWSVVWHPAKNRWSENWPMASSP